MADNDTRKEDRRLPPSAKKLKQAREQGQIPRSRELGHVLLLGLTGSVLFGFSDRFGAAARGLLASGLRFDRALATSEAALATRLAQQALDAFWILAPVGVAGAMAGFVATVSLAGIAPTLKPLEPKASRMNPVSGLKRLFSVNHLIDSARLAVLVIGMALLTGLYVWLRTDAFVGLEAQPIGPAASHAYELLFRGALWLFALLLLVATIDAPMQWFRHRAELRMTVQEAKDEAKEAEGNPEVKGRIRAKQREMSVARMMQRLPLADVVVTNPTHYAVALQYEDGAMSAPRVIAKGSGFVALRIRELAAKHDIPLFEAPPLARALFKHVEIDAEVPSALYNAVAQVLAYVYQLGQYRRGDSRRAPLRPDKLPVPDELDPGRGETAGATP